MDGAPTFPPPSVVERAMELGFGSGPWERGALDARWGEPTANRFISDAKKAGWLLAPYRNQFFVPSARDLMVVDWLSGILREEFVISRMLAVLGLRSWCFSAWARKQGLVFPEPLFVSDLAPEAPGEARSPAFLDNLLIVPEVPPTSAFRPLTQAVLPAGISQAVGRPVSATDDMQSTMTPPGALARMIPYELSPEVDDPAWVLALAAALPIPRIAERMEQIVNAQLEEDRKRPTTAAKGPRRKPAEAFLRRWERWQGRLGAPEPNRAWQERLKGKAFSYLLVPPSVWQELSSAGMAVRFESLGRWRRVLDARTKSTRLSS